MLFRSATVAVLRLIGFRRGRILQHVLAEGVVIALAGAVFGVLLSLAMQGGINQFFQWRYDTALVFVRVTQPDLTDPQHLYNPADYDFALAPKSAAIDAGTVLPNVTDGFTGRAPDLGALELGVPAPHYGPRN